MSNDFDPQADAVVDRLLAELEAAQVKGAEVRAKNQPLAETRTDIKPPVFKSALYKKIQEKGNLSEKDIMKLVAKEVRRGI